VCIGDFWAASEGLDDLIIRIGRMISYQEYNTKSPLNGLAAKWAEQNAKLFPVDPRDIAPPADQPKTETVVAIEPVPETATEIPSNNGADVAQENPAVAGVPNQSNGQGDSSDPWAERITVE
jgi:hypothetical protein